ncbi:hypothetical protein GEMRC1_001674 [Eukaryota sp. GEM-RC1]
MTEVPQDILPKPTISELLKQHSVIEAADTALEKRSFDELFANLEEDSFPMVIKYLLCAVQYFVPSETAAATKYIAQIQLDRSLYSDALISALSINDEDLAKHIVNRSLALADPGHLLQISHILDRSGYYSLLQPSPHFSPDRTYSLFLSTVKHLEMEEPKDSESIYKSRLSESMYTSSTTADRAGQRRVDSATMNLAQTFTNAFVHAGYSKDSIYSSTQAYVDWTSRQKARGITSAAAAPGLTFLWNPEEGVNFIDNMLNSSDPQAIAGGYLGICVVNSGYPNEDDLPLHLVSDALVGEKGPESQIMSSLGIGIAYVGTNREDIAELLSSNMFTGNLELACISALSLGMIFVGSSDENVSQLIISNFFEKLESDKSFLSDPAVSLMVLGLGLIFLASEKNSTEILQALESAMENGEDNEEKKKKKKLCQSAHIMVSSLAQANNGNVLAIQNLLAHISSAAAESALEEEEKEDKPQPKNTQKKKKSVISISPVSVSVLCLAIISGSESVGNDLALRLCTSINQFSTTEAKIAVPAALAYLSWSYPRTSVIEALVRLSHDTDTSVAAAGILALGLVGQGTNHTRIAQNLRRLADHYSKDNTLVLACRIAQGLLHTGKGLVAATPFTMEGKILSKRALAGVLPVLIGLLDPDSLLLHRLHVLFFTLAPALKPRFVVTVDSHGELKRVSSRVGRAVDTVGMPGRPLKVTGFQTHETPVVVSRGDRADFGDVDIQPYCDILEGVVVIKDEQ